MKTLLTLTLLFIVEVALTQNIGIGTGTPLMKLHVNSTSDTTLLLVDNNVTMNNGTNVGMYFRNGSWYTAAIKTTGTGSNVARLGFYTFASGNTTGLKERLSINDNGFIGINTILPDSTLDINGNLKVTGGGRIDNLKTNQVIAGTINTNALMINSVPATFDSSRNTGFWGQSLSNQSFSSTFFPVLDAEIFDHGNDFNTSTGIYTVPANGVYNFIAEAGFTLSGTVNSYPLTLTIITPSLTTYGNNGMIIPGSFGGFTYLQCSALMELTAGTQLKLRITTNANAGTQILNSIKFKGYRIY